MKFPKISIVTISYNQGHYLEQTITSVLNQNYPNLEYIIIDGGSTDNSVEIIKKYSERLAYWVSERDNGMYDAIQKGFDRSTGEIMAWINSDDYYHNNAFFVVSEIFASYQDVEWLQGIPSIIDEAGRIVNVLPYKRWSKYNYYIKDSSFIQQESCFWRRSLWEKNGSKINSTLKYAGDYALWLSFFDHAQLYCVDTIIGGFRMRTRNQLSLDHMQDYLSEGKQLLEARIIKNTFSEVRRSYFLLFYQKVLKYFPIVNLIYFNLFIEKHLPARISFDRETQAFVKIKPIHKNIFSKLRNFVVQQYKGNF